MHHKFLFGIIRRREINRIYVIDVAAEVHL